ncbi:MAG: hypothetical protein KAY65_16815, partial [Planctomycetes bacterium]|nr:hypothetical protein [Planctomycetota bacterium]
MATEPNLEPLSREIVEQLPSHPYYCAEFWKYEIIAVDRIYAQRWGADWRFKVFVRAKRTWTKGRRSGETSAKFDMPSYWLRRASSAVVPNESMTSAPDEKRYWEFMAHWDKTEGVSVIYPGPSRQSAPPGAVAPTNPDTTVTHTDSPATGSGIVLDSRRYFLRPVEAHKYRFIYHYTTAEGLRMCDPPTNERLRMLADIRASEAQQVWQVSTWMKENGRLYSVFAFAEPPSGLSEYKPGQMFWTSYSALVLMNMHKCVILDDLSQPVY